MKSDTELYRAALEEINVIPQGQAVQGNMAAKAEQKWDALFSELETADRAPFARDTIPDELFDPLAVMLASRLSRSFRVDERRRIALQADAWNRRNPDSAIRQYLRLTGTGTAESEGTREAAFF